jgi:hypothetical protein
MPPCGRGVNAQLLSQHAWGRWFGSGIGIIRGPGPNSGANDDRVDDGAVKVARATKTRAVVTVQTVNRAAYRRIDNCTQAHENSPANVGRTKN